MENESNSKIEKLEKCIDKHAKDIKKLKKKSQRKMTAMKFVGVAFDPEKYKAGEEKLTKHYLKDLKSYVTLRQLVEL